MLDPIESVTSVPLPVVGVINYDIIRLTPLDVVVTILQPAPKQTRIVYHFFNVGSECFVTGDFEEEIDHVVTRREIHASKEAARAHGRPVSTCEASFLQRYDRKASKNFLKYFDWQYADMICLAQIS